MLRPCFLVVDREYPGSLSTRKLVIETAKLNVITAYSAREALDTLQRFPDVNGVIIDLGVTDMTSEDLVVGIKKLQPKLPVIIISSPGFDDCPDADYHLESFQPAKLLDILKTLQPEEYAEIERRNEQLSREQGAI
jgi:DNA-binding NtrC family response regulator